MDHGPNEIREFGGCAIIGFLSGGKRVGNSIFSEDMLYTKREVSGVESLRH